jgi:hypothetical protein
MGLKWHHPQLPWLGGVNWSDFLSMQIEVGYDSRLPLRLETGIEGTQTDIEHSIAFSKHHLKQLMS